MVEGPPNPHISGPAFALTNLRHFVNSLCEVAEEVLFDELMFLVGSSTRPKIDLKELADDMNEVSVGYSFISDSRNGLDGGRERMLERLAASSRADTLLRFRNGRVEVQSEEWRRYRLQLQRFLSVLLILIHTSNVTAGGVEILPIRVFNAPEARRNIFVHDGQVMIVTAYHKSQAITGQHKVIARFLGRRISRLLASYLVELRPFVALLDRDRNPKPARCFLWAGEKGIWKTPRATKPLDYSSRT